MSTAAYTALNRADAETPSDGQPRPSETSGDAAAGAPTAALDTVDELASDELPRGQPQNAGMDSPRPGAEPSETQLSETSESSRGSGRMCQCLCSTQDTPGCVLGGN